MVVSRSLRRHYAMAQMAIHTSKIASATKQMANNSNNGEITNNRNNNLQKTKKKQQQERIYSTGERQTKWTKLTRLLRIKISPLAIYLRVKCTINSLVAGYNGK